MTERDRNVQGNHFNTDRGAVVAGGDTVGRGQAGPPGHDQAMMVAFLKGHQKQVVQAS